MSDVAPLTLAQRYFIAAEVLRPGDGNVAIVIVRPSMDVAGLDRAIEALVSRHEVLRSVLHPGHRTMTPLDEWTAPVHRAPVDRGRLGEVMAAATRQPFRWGREPPFRAHIHECGDSTVVQLVTSHAVTDSWSNGLLRGDLLKLYDSILAGEAHPERAPSFLDVARAQALAKVDDWAAAQHWSNVLADPPTLRALAPHPFDEAIDVVERPLSDIEVRSYRALGQRHRATPFMVGTALMAHSLGGLCDVGEVIIWTTVANRRAHDREVVGLFANAVPLRVPVSGDLDEVVVGARSAALRAMQHSWLPLPSILKAAAVDLRSLAARLGTVVSVTHSSTPARREANAYAGSGRASLVAPSIPASDFGLPYHVRIEIGQHADRTSTWFRRGMRETVEHLHRSWSATLSDASATDDDNRS